MVTGANTSANLHVEVEVREDEESASKFQDSIDLLLGAGYFRARIKAIPPFDRIVGGMVWCITLCNRTVDVDLIYSESSSIKQKIALTEKVVEVLPKLKCPYSIEPHQIQGLDFINIYPVIQWLVKQALEAKERQEDTLKNHALFFFQNHCQLQKSNVYRKESAKLDENVAVLKSLIYPRRKYRRPRGFVCENLREDVQCTLMEYAWQPEVAVKLTDKKEPVEDEKLSSNSTPQTANERIIQQFSKECERETQKQNVPTYTLAKLIDITGLQEAAEDVEKVLKLQMGEDEGLEKQLSNAKSQLHTLKTEERALDQALLAIEGSIKKIDEETEQCQKQIAVFCGKNKELDGNEIERYKKLLVAYDEIKGREAQFKNDCKRKLQKMNEELESIETELSKAESMTTEQQAEKHKQILEQLNTIRDKDAALSREIVVVQRRIDSVPSKTEIAQYQRRIIELYNQMAVRNRVIKQLYNQYNSLSTIILYKQKELDLMNNIEEIQEQAMKESYKQSFLENLLKFEMNVQALYDKVSAQEKEKEIAKEKCREEYQNLLEKERRYYKLVEDFKEECQKNEAYNLKLESTGIIVDG